ncbi:MAG: indolepyruvate oxidoreductase subunit beta [Desulfurivibrio sp.]|nr:indolepyruvate oxidoreductase subunit beta [Desulfurivibrio sp.]MBU4119031.1 indolepyruvate oxidoreductase subunit beta [Pseudomonadota bacterium]
MKEQGNIHFCGVGGQGILLASELTAHALLAAGFDAKKSEVHGMAQRGGSVEAHLRFGKTRVYSPLIEPGTVDIMLAFEMMEAVRYLPFLNKKSIVIVNTQKIAPPIVATGKMVYPDHCLDAITQQGIALVPVDAFAIARKVGNLKAVNVALVGVLSLYLPIDEATWVEVLKKRLPAKILDVNLKAFQEGRKAGK